MITDEKERIVFGPFAWERQDDEKCEVWRLQTDRALNLTAFCVKNYGGTPGPGFRGWKLVSGGPFDDAGAYSTRMDAIRGVTPYLIAYYHMRALEAKEQAEKTLALLDQFLAKVQP